MNLHCRLFVAAVRKSRLPSVRTAQIVTVQSSDATHRSPHGSNKAVELVIGGLLPARAGVVPPHLELRATANASLVGNVLGERAVKQMVVCNLSGNVGGRQFFQHDIPKFEIESTELNPSFRMRVGAAIRSSSGVQQTPGCLASIWSTCVARQVIVYNRGLTCQSDALIRA